VFYVFCFASKSKLIILQKKYPSKNSGYLQKNTKIIDFFGDIAYIIILSNEESDSFKLYMNNIELLTNLSEFLIYLIKNIDAINENMIGMLCENYVCKCQSKSLIILEELWKQ